jgi:hypothetical protein
MNPSRHADLEEFYQLLAELAATEEGPRLLASCTGRDGWPRYGVYFFFEEGQTRADGGARVVRVGTHALKPTDKTTLWKRLRQHRGRIRGRNPGGGNHRESIFRGHVGAALIQRDRPPAGLLTSWTSNHPDPEWAAAEDQLERRVSLHIGSMPFLWLAIPTRPDGNSDRAFVERNSIALLSCATGSPDKPAPGWLGHHAPNQNICRSGLWNSNHVDEPYQPQFLNILASLTRQIRPPTA